MNIYMTRPVQKQAGEFKFTSTFNDLYEQMLRGEQVTATPEILEYAVDLSYPHVRTAFFAEEQLQNIGRPLDTAQALLQRITRYTNVMSTPAEEYNQQYTQFQIPKRSGGFRTIDAPSEGLKQTQRDILYALQYEAHLIPHETAHAYIKGRSPKTSLEIHQYNKSKWFLKLDIKDFFPSCTHDFVIAQLQKLYPMHTLELETIGTILEPCFLQGALPQGAITSPLLSNLVMTPLDFTMNSLQRILHQHFIYTRYADDILISSEYDFDFKLVEKTVEELWEDTPFKIKHEKTRYGSIAGQNWNLGLMLNKDNNITVGTKRKNDFKHALFNLFTDFKKGIAWSTADKLQLQGIRSYIHNIEPEYINGVIQFYEQKLGVSWKEAIKIL